MGDGALVEILPSGPDDSKFASVPLPPDDKMLFLFTFISLRARSTTLRGGTPFGGGGRSLPLIPAHFFLRSSIQRDKEENKNGQHLRK